MVTMLAATEDKELVCNPMHSFSTGRQWEASGQWARAQDCYQRTLASMPHILGTQPWFRRYIMDGRQPPIFDARQTADVYAALGRCHAARQKPHNALLAFQAAAQWHPSENTLHLLNAAQAEVRRASAAVMNSKSPAGRDLNSSMDQIHDQVTLVIFTNFTRKLVKYAELSPPSSRLVATTYKSMLQSLGATVILCPKLLCYDRPAHSDADSGLYEKALDLFCRQHGFEMTAFPHVGLHAILRNILPRIATPYLLLVEHDWFFQGTDLSLPYLLNLFDDCADIHHVRLNKRSNRIANWDFILEFDDRRQGIPLLRTSTYSNNPCMIRTQTLRNRWLPMCASDPDFSALDQRGSAMGIEEPLLKCFMQDIRRSGFSAAHREWGTYIYGGIGDPERIVHLGE